MANSSATTGMQNPAYKGFIILLLVTFLEVGAALLNIHGIVHIPKLVLALLMCALGIYKAWYIIFQFMHMGHERKAFAITVLLPFILLVWFIIALLMEGNSVLNLRNMLN